jgi:hypothetical protein
VFAIKLRVGLLGLLAMLLVGSLAPAAALAEGGPFCHHSQNGVTDNGQIKARMPEQIAGSGGEQRFEAKLGGTAFTFVASGVQIKGIIYNNEDQCQAKLEVQYQPIKFEPEIAHCKLSFPHNNVVKIFAHAAWKWLGTEAEQKENPIRQGRGWMMLPAELQQKAKELPKAETFTVINIEKDGTGECLLASKQNRVAGSIFAETAPASLGEFREEERLTLLSNGTLQQFWNGQYPLVGAESGLTIAGAAAKFTGSFTIKPIGRQRQPPQFIGYFEK